MPNGEAIKLLTMAGTGGGGMGNYPKKVPAQEKITKTILWKKQKKNMEQIKTKLFQDLKLKKFLLRNLALHVSVRRLILSPQCHHVVHNPFKQ